jgi:hypothetical protein
MIDEVDTTIGVGWRPWRLAIDLVLALSVVRAFPEKAMTQAYEIVEHSYDVVIVGAGGAQH